MKVEELLAIKDQFFNLTKEQQTEILSSLSSDELEELNYCWPFWAREEQLLPPLEEDWNIFLLLAGRSAGKCVVDSTPILTANKDWITIGEVEIGDKVFDETGNLCNVLATYKPFVEKTYEVTFDTGEKIICCNEHLWTVWDSPSKKNYFEYRKKNKYSKEWYKDYHVRFKNGKKRYTSINDDDILKYEKYLEEGYSKYSAAKLLNLNPKTLENALDIKNNPRDKTKLSIGKGPRTIDTDQIFDEMNNGNSFFIPCCFPVNYEHKKLPLDEYFIGLWLSDGSSARPKIESADPEVIHHILNRTNFICREKNNGNSLSKSYFFYGPEIQFYNSGIAIKNTNSIKNKLKEMNLINNKHIPECYMKSSVNQRIDLLRGLMDGDGHVSPRGFCTFYNTNKRLAKQVHELVCSLGMKSTFVVIPANKNNYRNNAESYNVRWTVKDFNPFHLSRKSKRCEKALASKKISILHRKIVSVKIANLPNEGMTCLTVDSPSNLFLCTRSFIPFKNTRAASEAIRQLVCGSTPEEKGKYSRIALIGMNEKSTRDVMVTGDAGILSVHPKEFSPEYISSQAKLIWPNGAIATLYNDSAPENLRGPRFDCCWIDEVAAFKNAEETFSQIQMCCGLGNKPIQIYTTTPHTRKAKLLKKIMNRDKTVVRRSSSFANAANMTADFFETMKEMYDGTRIAKQEMYGELIEDVEGALWNNELIRYTEDVITPNDARNMELRVVVGVDPSGSVGGDECGIVVAGATTSNPKTYYVLEDASVQGSPTVWANKARNMYEKWFADKIVAEANYGGTMVEAVLQEVDSELPVKIVHASKGKMIRAEPISALYEQGKVFHGNRKMVELETEMTEYDGASNKKSPNRLDAMVWTMTELKAGNYYTKEQREKLAKINLNGLSW